MIRAVFRVDSSQQIGSGHLVRCITLAANLKTKGISIHFICRDLPGHLTQIVTNQGYEYTLLPNPVSALMPNQKNGPAQADWLGVSWEVDAEEVTQIIRNSIDADWLIVDHYALDARWERRLRPYVGGIMVIDDLVDRAHDCDMILNQNISPDIVTAYSELVPVHCIRLLGPRYALLREEFLGAKNSIEPVGANEFCILLYFGASDTHGLTLTTIKAIHQVSVANLKVDVVIGASNPAKDEIRELCSASDSLTFHCQVENMAELMFRADLAIGAGGTTIWEHLMMGVPSIVIAVADNQVGHSRYLSDIGAICYLGEAASVSLAVITSAVSAFVANPWLLEVYGDRFRNLVDGHGTARVAKLLASPAVWLRDAVHEDCEAVYAWRNDPVNRANANTKEEINKDTHEQWYAETLEADDRKLLIGESEAGPIGVIRFDIEGEKATISIYLAPGMHGKGCGPLLLQAGEQWLMKNCPSVKTSKAYVLTSNVASSALFHRLGYNVSSTIYEKELGAQ